jgi:DNA-binding NarL/FixJ family response regulator
VKVLVIDPSALIRTRLIARLTEAGLDIVGQATSSALARGYARITTPDAIVLDVELADRGGLALIAELKEIAPEAILVVLTNALPYRRYCLQLGADAFLDKSTDFDALSELLTQARPGMRTGS